MKKFILPIIFAILASSQLWQPGYFTMQDNIHVFRLQQFDQCVADKQIPCRFISMGGMGYGYPLFNFYSPFPYAFSEIFHLIGFSYIDSLKIAFITPFFLSAIGMYLLGNSFFGFGGGLISSVLYTFAPYHAIDAFVRGALAEHWALSLLPLILFALFKEKQHLFILTLSILLLSHNLTAFYFLPVLLLLALTQNKIKFVKKLIVYPILLTSFFILPAIFEKNLTTVATMTQGYFNYIIHFATLNQLFISRFWGYGASLWGPVDDMSFQIGIVHWSLAFIAIMIARRNRYFKLLILVFLIGLFGLFLTHNKSTFIWQLLPFMAYYQFPWRFLGLTTLMFSFLAGSITQNKYLVTLILIATIFLNLGYFKVDIWQSVATDNDFLTPAKIYEQSGAGLRDYWPKYSSDFPTVMAPVLPLAIEGNITNISSTRNSHQLTGKLSVSTQEAVVVFPLIFFPNWKLTIDGQSQNYDIDQKYGQIKTKFNQGQHDYVLTFSNTAIRTYANLITLVGISLYIIKLLRENKT